MRAERTNAIEFRKLRIAWSVVCGIACVLLIVLWVRSYDGMNGRLFPWSRNRTLAIASLCGEVGIVCFPRMNYIGISPNEKFDWEKFPDYPYSRLNRTALPHFTRRYPPYRANFHWFRIYNNWYVGVPYWFLILSATLLGSASWIRWKKRFSLRTLLITTAVVAVVLGVVAYGISK